MPISANQPMTAAVSVNHDTKKGPDWLLGNFLFGTEIGWEQLKKPPCIFVRMLFSVRIYSYIRSYAFFGYEYISIFVRIIFLIQIYLDIPSFGL